MKKLLTIITLLCFSVTANADVYFCETAANSTIDPDGRNASTVAVDSTVYVDGELQVQQAIIKRVD
jgi:hypothetical protein